MVKCTVMEEVGTIKSTDGLFAVVSVPRKSLCEGCTLSICKPDANVMEIEALNAAKAGVGQKVRVVMESSSYMKSAGIVLHHHDIVDIDGYEFVVKRLLA